MQSEKDQALYTALRQCWTVPRCQTISGYLTFVFIFIEWMAWMSFLASTLYDDDLFFALMITPGYYLDHAEVADQDSASGSL